MVRADRYNKTIFEKYKTLPIEYLNILYDNGKRDYFTLNIHSEILQNKDFLIVDSIEHDQEVFLNVKHIYKYFIEFKTLKSFNLDEQKKLVKNAGLE